MHPIIREAAAGYGGPSVTCPNCSTVIAIEARAGFTIRAPRDAVVNLPDMATLEREELRVLLMDNKNRVSRIVTVYQGNVTSTLVRMAELFTEAVRDGATGMILVHNHPSGDPTPSPDDLHLTAEAIAAGRLLKIDVLDHVVIAQGGAYVSLRDRGVVFDRPTRIG